MVMAVVVGLALGAVTALAQGSLGVLDPLVNSAGSWCLVAGALAVRERRPLVAAGVGAVTLWALLGGYLIATEVRGLSMQTTFIIFWAACGAVGGPAVGLGASWAATESGWRSALGAAVLPALLTGEALYALTTIRDTTGAVYWVLELAVGMGLLALWAARRRPATGQIALAAGLTAAGATAFAVLARTVPIGG